MHPKTVTDEQTRTQRDPPVKQLILSMDEEKHFMIQDLDETHLLVSADSVSTIKEQLEDEVGLLKLVSLIHTFANY